MLHLPAGTTLYEAGPGSGGLALFFLIVVTDWGPSGS